MAARLKSLELQGYKTFANRTLFHFSPTVTVIVGPNGSGKSNIADSLRWVLGEQSYALLRGKKTEDMIFAGSESRARAGMASATILLDNSDGWLPIEFSEVAITRRAYRDGVNEYLINGQRVRLRDVSELLAQAGLAERTYTIIGQGLVDAALSLRPDERRRLFEEAAGIGLYRARRDEALRRLEVTQRNLERVHDILSELRPRLESLERQARRAEEYETLRANLQSLLRQWYGYHWHTLQGEVAEATELARRQEERLEQARAQVLTWEKRLGELHHQVEKTRNELANRRAALLDLQRQREALEREAAVAAERLRSLQMQKDTLQSELARLGEEKAFYEETRRAAEAELQRLQTELEQARREGETARHAWQTQQEARAARESALLSLQEEVARCTEEKNRLQARLDEKRLHLERLHQNLPHALQAQEEARRARIARQERLEAARRAVQEAEQRLQQAEMHLQAQNADHARLEEAYRQVQEHRDQLKAQLAHLQTQIEVLLHTEGSPLGLAVGAQALLEAAAQGRLRGLRGVLGTLFSVPPDFEVAIGAALGEYLEAVLLEAEQSEAALDMLNEQGLNGALLPLSSLRPSPPLSGLRQAEGVFGLAVDLVSAPAEVRPALQALLGQTLVVRDRKTAQRVLQNQPPEVRAVTLQGEVFHGSGLVLTRGAQRKDASRSPWERSRRLRQLEAERSAVEKALAQATADAQRRQNELEISRARLETLTQEQQAARQAWQNASQEVERAALETQAAEAEAQRAEAQVVTLGEEIAELQSEREQLTQALARWEHEEGKARQALEAKRVELQALDVGELHAQQIHWSTRQALLERFVREQEERLQERLTEQGRLERRLETVIKALHQVEQEWPILEGQRADSLEKMTQLEIIMEELNGQLAPLEASLRQLEEQQAAGQREEQAARQALSLAEHLHAQARIQLARRQEALQTLQRRIEEDFGLVAFDYGEKVSGAVPLPLEGFVEQLPPLSQLPEDLEESIRRLRAQLRRLGPVNLEVQQEYHEVRQRYTFLTEQVADLQRAEQDVRQVIAELDERMKQEFQRTFEAVAQEFRQIFSRLFGGGSARLVLTDPDDPNTSGIEIEARLPGRREQGLALLSGGERSLTATALVFALLKVSPTPFCVLDEVDAMLDEANVGRFLELLRQLSQSTQFVIITHNRNTVQAADVIYGVTMGRDSASQVLSLRLDEVARVLPAE